MKTITVHMPDSSGRIPGSSQVQFTVDDWYVLEGYLRLTAGKKAVGEFAPGCWLAVYDVTARADHVVRLAS